MRKAFLGLVLVIVAVPSVAGCGGRSAENTYGSLPAFLPRASLQPDGVLLGSATRPALTSEGDSVEVELPTGKVLATVTGPQVPGEGLPYQARATTCTWTISFTHATASLPIPLGSFTTIDDRGFVYHPVPVAGQPRPPGRVTPGQTVTFELRAVMLTGQGLMRWSPDGSRILAEWDFEVEND